MIGYYDIIYPGVIKVGIVVSSNAVVYNLQVLGSVHI